MTPRFLPSIGNAAASTLKVLLLRRVGFAEFSDSPLLMALAWLAGGGVQLADFLLFAPEDWPGADSVLAQSTIVLLSGLLAAWVMGRRADSIRIGNAFLLASLAVNLAWLAFRLLSGAFMSDALASAGELEMLALWLWFAVAQWKFLRNEGAAGHARRALAAVVLFAALSEAAVLLPRVDTYVYALAYAPDGQTRTVVLDQEELWTGQQSLLDAARARLHHPGAGSARSLVLSVAAGGSQQLFGREAKAVGSLLGQRFGTPGRDVRLSNAEADLETVPLATPRNLAAILKEGARHLDRHRGLAVVYLTSHGSRRAELQTDLPDYARLRRISARGLAQALAAAGLERRVVIVSACYSGSWIKPLASPDTIVITAAAADRTSFGCDDSRQYTVFGQALLDSGLGKGASLHEAFERLRVEVARKETELGAYPSRPQAFVGANMRELWDQAGPAGKAAGEAR